MSSYGNYAGILPGARVRSAEGFIGTVERLEARRPAGTGATGRDGRPDTMVVRAEDGAWRYAIPLMLVRQVTQGSFAPLVEVALTPQQLPHYVLERIADPGHAKPVRQGDAVQPAPRQMGQPGGQVARVPLAREELVVRKRPVVRGRIRIHKGVETTEQRLTVPVAHEEAIVEHIPVEQYDGMPPSDPNEVIIPILEERLVVQKQTVVKEYLRIRKTSVTKEYEVKGKVRHETVRITEERAHTSRPDTAPLLHLPERLGEAEAPRHP